MQWGNPHAMTCGICGGTRTTLFPATSIEGENSPITCIHACMRCDTDVHGNGFGPPIFAAEWDSRRRDFGVKERGSE